MPIDILMPALSPTMESGTLSKWLVKEGDEVKAGDLLAEIETDKATMEFEAADEGTVAKLVVAEGTDEVKVGQLIAVLAEEGEDTAQAAAASDDGGSRPRRNEEQTIAASGAGSSGADGAEKGSAPAAEEKGYGARPAAGGGDADVEPVRPAPAPAATMNEPPAAGERINASPLARRIARDRGIALSSLRGSGPNGRIVKTDVEAALAGKASAAEAAPARATDERQPVAVPPAPRPAAPTSVPAATPAQPAGPEPDAPYEAVKLSSMRKVIARRLTEAKQQIPHIYLTVDVRLDALLKLRKELNEQLKTQLSVNDLLIKALAVALRQVPAANVQYAGDRLLKFSRADISVAVAIPDGLITPIIRDAGSKRLSDISSEMRDLAARARDGKLKPEEYQGGTASLSNLGMFGIKHFDAVVNPPQAMILAVGAGEKRPVVTDDALSIATIMTATGSFDHRAIDGAIGAELLAAFKRLCENPLTMLA